MTDARVYLEAGESTEKVAAILGALGYQVVRRFVRRRLIIDQQLERLARPLAAADRETLHAMLVTDDAQQHARLVGVDEGQARRREEWVLIKLHARDRLELLRRIAGLEAGWRGHRGR